MPEEKVIVINTGPLIALTAATGSLDILQHLYSRVIVPFEVGAEILAGGQTGFAVPEFHAAAFLDKQPHPTSIGTFLHNTLDTGEASVIQTALDLGISTVCIDEAVGRRIARLNGLLVTGSLGILIRAKQEGLPVTISTMIDNMQRHDIWLGKSLAEAAIKLADE